MTERRETTGDTADPAGAIAAEIAALLDRQIELLGRLEAMAPRQRSVAGEAEGEAVLAAIVARDPLVREAAAIGATLASRRC